MFTCRPLLKQLWVCQVTPWVFDVTNELWSNSFLVNQLFETSSFLHRNNIKW